MDKYQTAYFCFNEEFLFKEHFLAKNFAISSFFFENKNKKCKKKFRTLWSRAKYLFMTKKSSDWSKSDLHAYS